MPLIATQVRIEGRVQGVWFRRWTLDQATARGLSGWVRNRRDGTVEAVFQGEEATVGDMVALCWQGPPAALVTKVTEQTVAQPAPEGFRQLPTE